MTERDISQLSWRPLMEATAWDQLERKIKTQHRQNVTTTWCVWGPRESKCVF